MSQSVLQACLAKKMELIKAICANNASQQRQLRCRNLRAIRRLLRERAALIEELRVSDSQLAAIGTAWQQQPNWQPIVQTISQLQQDMLNSCRQLLQQTADERRNVAAELRTIKNARQLKNHYAPRWQGQIPGRRLSVKG